MTTLLMTTSGFNNVKSDGKVIKAVKLSSIFQVRFLELVLGRGSVNIPNTRAKGYVYVQTDPLPRLKDMRYWVLDVTDEHLDFIRVAHQNSVSYYYQIYHNEESAKANIGANALAGWYPVSVNGHGMPEILRAQFLKYTPDEIQDFVRSETAAHFEFTIKVECDGKHGDTPATWVDFTTGKPSEIVIATMRTNKFQWSIRSKAWWRSGDHAAEITEKLNAIPQEKGAE